MKTTDELKNWTGNKRFRVSRFTNKLILQYEFKVRETEFAGGFVWKHYDRVYWLDAKPEWELNYENCV